MTAMWPWGPSKEELLHQEIDRLKSRLINAEYDLLKAHRELADARINGKKVRARARALRLERRRLRALLERHGISSESSEG